MCARCSINLLIFLVISLSQIAAFTLHCFLFPFVLDMSLVEHGADVETTDYAYAEDLQSSELDCEVEDVKQKVVDDPSVGDQVDERWRRVLSRNCHK